MSLLPPSKLVEIRRRLGVSQERLAQLLNVSFVSVNRWENQHSVPAGSTADLYRAIELALDRGATPARILDAAELERGQFLFQLFQMAHGPQGAP